MQDPQGVQEKMLKRITSVEMQVKKNANYLVSSIFWFYILQNIGAFLDPFNVVAYLRCAVPACAHVVGVGRSGADLTCQPKVRNFDQVRGRAQDVLGLQVPVEEWRLMEKRMAANG